VHGLSGARISFNISRNQARAQRTAFSCSCDQWTNHTIPAVTKLVPAKVNFEARDIMQELYSTRTMEENEGVIKELVKTAAETKHSK
jgi:hypothetical protein